MVVEIASWLRQEVERAIERSESIPGWAKPVLIRRASEMSDALLFGTDSQETPEKPSERRTEPPSGGSKDVRPSWDEYFLGIAQAVSVRGDCTRRQVGAVIVGTDHRIIETGYNGAPSGKPGCLTDSACPRGKAGFDEVPHGSSYDTGPGSCIAIHAEANAIILAGIRSRGATIYITCAPCDGCKRLIDGAGITRVVYP